MNSETPKKLILASQSPRRKKLLEELGLTFEIIPSNIDEVVDPDIPVEESVKMLAFQKAEDISKKINYPAVIIGCDTTVVINGKSLGKPENFDEAFQMLQTLSGNYHTVISGLSVIDTTNGKVITESVSSQVLFKKLTDEEITRYIKTGEPMDKAGAYAIQGVGSIFVSEINGCYNNIVGLPVFKLAQMLELLGIDILV